MSLAQSPSVRGMMTTPGHVVMDWSDPTAHWVLQRSQDLRGWCHVDAARYARVEPDRFSFADDLSAEREYFRLHKVGQDRFCVVGDSISTRKKWPHNLALLTGRTVYSQAVGGSHSPQMVAQAQGVELAYPIPGVHKISPGRIQVRWHRHMALLTRYENYRTQWAECAKSVSEPETLEIYMGTRFLGLAQRVLKPFTTEYASDPRRIVCRQHGLQDGDRVVFMSTDPNWPVNLSVLSAEALWSFSSPNLPAAVVERRVYFVAHAEADSFEIKEFSSDTETLDLGGNAQGENYAECGWYGQIDYPGGTWNLKWHSRTEYDDWIWLIEASANDFAGSSAVTVTIPNTETLLDQSTEIQPRFVLVCPPIASGPPLYPGSYGWTNYYNTYMPWVRSAYPDNHIDTMALLGSMRTPKELGFLQDPAVPELLWIRGDPRYEDTWEASADPLDGGYQMWVGPGYTPLQFRAGFYDGIHLGAAGNQALASAVAAFVAAKGW